ncbi:MAG: hypothetical protein A2534_03045 [Candidatus Magasanikbacteria bacterium RIFOXYD2_FULL_39_9]|uniref:Uncharacterized protein n=1 Tax=Candidatus Magasanikbacteria bacterium RIFOXYD1_FULL_40_23 TaxID=1798705 RepID=A0A1F6P7Z2_9BACT|nr:MAG: hypothetical protein A2563_04850 [Candidatus Magasanikbacteria bacterium RIFOXYD1_FULL_40_23]OGH93488.1 MAG: hypothetical protein A2534_03045 [Candidatus Magasanikbacteria bacterium RIFOXYD2_FULL_39_9]
MLKKITIIFFALFFFFASSPVSAVDTSSRIPDLNPICWKRKACFEIRKNFLLGSPSAEQLEDGFISGPAAFPCVGGQDDNQWGRCLPGGAAKTEISFAGQNKFSNIGDFLVIMYRYLVGIASIVSVIVIIVAGVRWITSGGNSEAIGSAKKRIGGAIIGLFIAYMSYFVLNTINPALVNLRLPQNWLVRPQHLLPQFCKDVPGAKDGKMEFSYFAGAGEQTTPAKLVGNEKFDLKYGEQKDAEGEPVFMCGRRFLADGGGTQACFGDLCSREGQNMQMCGKGLKKESLTLCSPGELRIHFYIDYIDDIEEQLKLAAAKVNKSLLITGSLEKEWLKADQVFWGVCDAGAYTVIPVQDRGLIKQPPLRYYLADDGAKRTWADSSDKAHVERQIDSGGQYYEYLISYTGLVDNNESQSWNCKYGGQLVGYFLRLETAAQQSTWSDIGDVLTLSSPYHYPNLNVGYDSATDQPLFGTFSQDVGASLSDYSNYIPIEKLKNGGLRFEVGLTMGKYLKMVKNPGETPQRYLDDLLF